MTFPAFARAALLLCCCLVAWPAPAQDDAPADEPLPLEPVDPVQQSIERLADLRQQVLDKRRELESVRRKLKSTSQEEQRQQLERQLAELPGSIDRLNLSFDQIAIGGIDFSSVAAKPEEAFDWQQELLEITKPILASLKVITEKPRKLEQLRSEAVRIEQEGALIAKVVASIAALQERSPPKPVAERLALLAGEWQRKQAENRNALELASYRIATLEGQNVPVGEAVVTALNTFIHGRGLTLALAAVTVLGVWLLARLLLWLVQRGRRGAPERAQVRWKRLVLFGYRAATVVLAVIGMTVVFYTRGDLLLLALLLLGLFMAAISLRQTLPKYVDEIRLLLDMGAVREGERVIYEGVPMEVKAIRTYALLHNPALEGVVRLPLGQLTQLVSRPGADEPWFPCRPGDYVFLPDGRFGEVLRQTVETVLIKSMGSVVRFRTADFLALDFRNLSGGFGVAVTFGVDYGHQAISLTEVPARMRAAVAEALERAGLGGEVEDMVVELKEAATNSLDYLVYLTMNGRAAGSYFRIGRLVQQACVELCNREGWVIPFAQVTVHRAE